MEWQLVESDRALRQVLVDEADSDVVAVDTEFMRRNTFYPQVALVQLSFGSRAWLVDPLSLEDPGPLANLLTDPAVTKVLHSASEDLEVFQRWLGVLPSPLFDTQRAAALVDRGFGKGYRALVHDICGVDLPKGETRSNWLQRPLSESQCEYASLDVAWLLPVYRALRAQCESENKVDWVLSDGADATSGLASDSGDYHQRIKSAWKLDPRQLATLIAVCDWREETARRRDKPRSWIIDDKACLQLAQSEPRDWAQLRSCSELPAPALRRHGDELLEVVAAQCDLPDQDLPVSLPGPLDGPQRQRLKHMKQWARDIAARLGVAPEALLQSRDYEMLLRQANGEAVMEPRHWSGWRAGAIVQPLRERLAQETA